MSERHVAVIGAGFSGTLLALHLLRRCSPTTRIVLIERHAHFGLGQAYATENPNHLLNVRAARMSAFGDRPLDFLTWLRRHAEQTDTEIPAGHSFASRQLYGSYMRGLLNDELKHDGERLLLLRGDVTRVITTDAGVRLSLQEGRALDVDAAVLAVGNFPPEPPKVADPGFYDGPLYRPDPWRAEALCDLDPSAPVMLIGTGLTMVDVVISLLDNGHQGPIHAVSRRGLVPHRHVEGTAPRPPDPRALPASPGALLRLVREDVRHHVAQGGRWHEVIDQLRPFTQDVWQSLSQADRGRFLRHLRPWWDIHRHRMAGPVADRIDAVRASGQLRITAGRICGYAMRGDRAEVSYRPRFGVAPASFETARVVNCSGPACDYGRIADPLVASLMHDGLVRPDPLRLGLDVTASCALRSREGAIAANLFAVGPVTKGAFWEVTAVPDIRKQCETLAAHLSELPNMVHAARPVRISALQG